MNSSEHGRRQPFGNRFVARAISLFFFALFACVSWAQQKPGGASAESPEALLDRLLETPLETPVVSAASKHSQRANAAPSVVSVVTAEEIKRYGYRTLADVLASVRGLSITYDRNYSYLGARGFNLGDYNSRVLILVDGHHVNNNLSDGGFIGNEFILDADLIESVE